MVRTKNSKPRTMASELLSKTKVAQQQLPKFEVEGDSPDYGTVLTTWNHRL